jgi:hypothetical protein
MMDVLDLPEVTLCCIDTRTPDLALRAMKRSATQIRYGDVLLLTSVPPAGELPDGWRCELVRGINSAADYSHFVLKELYARIRTKFVLIVQWDGYVAQPVAWQDAFLACDYIGAVWPQFNDAHTVGNGGFSLRSTRLMALMAGQRTWPLGACTGISLKANMELYLLNQSWQINSRSSATYPGIVFSVFTGYQICLL